MRPSLEVEEMTSNRHLLEMDPLGLNAAAAGFLTLNSKGVGAVVKRVTHGERVPNLPPSKRRMAARSRAIMKEPTSDR